MMMQRLLHTSLLLLTFSSLTSCRLVADFLAAAPNGCPQFFLNTREGPVTPTVLQDGQRYRQICQRYLGKDRYATLYDTENRIPVYSAYRHVRQASINRVDEWWTEPELTSYRQANNRDYAGSGMYKGQLYPAHQNNDAEGVDATFTLTNAVPLNQSLHTRWLNKVVNKLNKHIQATCRNKQAYIVTGVVPDPVRTVNRRVKEVSHLWTAYCCLNEKGKRAARGAFLMDQMGTMLLFPKETVPDLENFLNNVYYSGPFRVFGGRC